MFAVEQRVIIWRALANSLGREFRRKFCKGYRG